MYSPLPCLYFGCLVPSVRPWQDGPAPVLGSNLAVLTFMVFLPRPSEGPSQCTRSGCLEVIVWWYFCGPGWSLSWTPQLAISSASLSDSYVRSTGTWNHICLLCGLWTQCAYLIFKRLSLVWECNSVVECSPGICKALDLISSIKRKKKKDGKYCWLRSD